MAKMDLSSIDLSKIKKEYTVLICAVLIIAIPFFYYKNVFQPALRKIRGLSIQIQQRKYNIQQAKVGPEVLTALESEMNEIKPQIDYYQQRLQVQTDIPQILKELNKMAEELGIKFVSVNPLEKVSSQLPQGEGALVKIPIRIKLKCGYHELGKFINQIENFSRFMQVTELKIEQNPQNIWAHNAELVIISFSLALR